MYTWYFFLSLFITALGAFSMAYQLYKIVILDANCRGMPHQKFWGIFSMGATNGSGLIFYLLRRQKYPVKMTATESKTINTRKKKAYVSLIFLAIGTIVLFSTLISHSM